MLPVARNVFQPLNRQPVDETRTLVSSAPVVLLAGVIAIAVLGLNAWLVWPQIRFRWLFEPLGANAQGFSEYRHRQTGIVMVKLPGGKVWIGGQRADPNGQNYDPHAGDHETVCEVTVAPFLIGKYEVTRAQWRPFGKDLPPPREGDNRTPAVLVPGYRVTVNPWTDTPGFSERTGLSLPSEAQWVYASRGGSLRVPEEPPGWFAENSEGKLHRIGETAPNGFGLDDMFGNVQEWCIRDLEGETCTFVRLGGSWITPRRTAVVKSELYDPAIGDDDLGFRPAYYPLP